MSQADRDKWESKYRDGVPLGDIEPDEELTHYAEYLPNRGTALDLACGRGKNSLYLAQRGLQVTAADISQNGLDSLMQSARTLGLGDSIQPRCLDLDNHVFDPGSFDLVVVVRFLNRTLFRTLQDALKPGGILLYKTFNQRFLEQRPGFNPEFTIEAEELVTGFPELEVIADNRGNAQSEYALFLGRKTVV